MVKVQYRGVALAALMALVPVGADAAAGYKVLYRFAGAPNDGSYPSGALLVDSAGNLYGTTKGGGAADHGTVYELSPPTTPNGAWTEIILFSFGPYGDIGGTSPAAGLIMDSLGNLYGTAEYGGTSVNYYGFGVAFKLSPPAVQGGKWTETVLYRFGLSKRDGVYPLGPLTMDGSGALYGTTGSSRDGSASTVFKLTAPVSGTGSWTGHTLYSAPYQSTDAGLIIDQSGRIYGVNGNQTFRLTPPTAGEVAYRVSSIPAPPSAGDSANSNFGFTMDSSLNLYVLSTYGVYKATPPGSPGKVWETTWLHSFGSTMPDGASPLDSPSFDALGNLYYTTASGGRYNNGALLRLEPGKGNIWSETLLRSGTQGSDGSYPSGGVIFDQAGNAYGTMQDDGIKYSNSYSCCGVVYEWVKS